MGSFIVRYYGSVSDARNRKPNKTLPLAIVLAITLFLLAVSIDPFREVRKFNPVQSWSQVHLVDRTMPDDIVVFETVQGRVFRFSQDPIVVFAGIGGNVNELTTTLRQDAEESKDPKFENLGIMKTFGLPVTLKSGRNGDFFITNSSVGFTCQLVIRPLKGPEFGSIFDWLSR
jgi:hypothetical protein